MTSRADTAYDTLPKLFLRNVDRYGERVALREKVLGIWRRITWNEYRDHVRHFGLGLTAMGLRKGDKVSVLGDNCPEWLYADLAVQSASGITVGIYPTDTAPQVKYILENSDSRFVVVKDQEQTDKVLEVKDALPLLEKVIVIDMKGLRRYTDPLVMSFEQVEQLGRKAQKEAPGGFESMVSRTRSEDAAIIVYTSGTTGPPKGAILSHRNALSMTQSMFEQEPLYDSDSLVSSLPLCHVAERMFSLFFALESGHVVNFAESVGTLQEDLKEISPTAFLQVPRIWEKMHSGIIIKMQDAVPFKRWVFKRAMPIGERVARYRWNGRKVPFIWNLLYGIAYLAMFRHLKNQLGLLQGRLFVSGAAPLSPDIIKFFHSIGIWIKESYGSTEMTGMVSIQQTGSIRPGTVGKVLPSIQCRIAEDGEILLSADSVFTGYYGNPDATASTIVDEWLYTGDVGAFDENGDLKILDRKKDIIITSGGKNITPSEIENKLKFSPYIKEAIIIGDRRKYIIALIQIELDNVSNWAQANRIAFTTYKSLALNERVRDLVHQEIEGVNKSLARVETIKKFTILDKELDQDDEELTATMKVRRSVIQEKFSDLIGELYR
ncbi:MAG: AMP-binding protein [Deltaproteobacteria bacterium]|nr:AMP-binding protein [Deltaproteobacteria bacterium]